MTMSSIFSIVARELEVIWSVATFSKACVDLADVDGGIDVAMPMFSRTDFGLSAAYVAFETFENAVNGSFGDAHIDIHVLLCQCSNVLRHSLLSYVNHFFST